MGKINYLIQRFREKISEGEIDNVLRELFRLGRDSEIANDIILLRSRFYHINNQYKQGLISNSEYTLLLNNLIAGVTSILDRISENEDILTVFQYEGTQYIIGLDFGDGESAISYSKISDDVQPQMIEFESKEKSIVTALLREGDGFRIGANAVVDAPEPRELEVNFKKAPSSADWKMAKRNIVDFVDTLFAVLYEQNLNINIKNSILYIGHPSSWNDDEVKIYQDIFKKIESLPSLEVVSESRSALINARDFSDIPKEKLKKNVLLIDIGSSTTDFTFLKNGKPSELAIGKNFGCKLIDLLIKKWAVDNHPKKEYWIEELRGKYGRNFRMSNYLTLLCRLYKEKLFGSKVQIAKPSDSDFIEVFENFNNLLEDKLNLEIVNKLKFDETVLPFFVGLTWQESFENLLVEVKSTLLEEIDSILVTGGGSRMDFVKDSCVEKFNIPEIQVFAGKTPSYAIAMGLAGYGKWKYRLGKFHKDVDDLCGDSLEKKIKEKAPDFLRKIMEVIFPLGYEKFAKPRIEKFINGKISMDVLGDSLLTYAGKEVADWLNNDDGKNYKEQVSKDFLDTVGTWLDEESNRICQTYNIPEGSLRVKFLIPTNVFENAFTDFVSKIGTSIAKATVGNLSIKMRKKLLSWILNENVDKIISLLYFSAVKGSIIFSDIIENAAKKLFGVSTHDMNAITVESNPFLQTAISLLKEEFSIAIHNKAEEVELFIS